MLREGAAQWLPRAKTSFMLVLCSRQIPAKANKLVLSYLREEQREKESTVNEGER